MEKIAQKCPSRVEFLDPLLDSKLWETHLFGGADNCLLATGGTGIKEIAATNFNLWLESLHPLDLLGYTDGFQEIDELEKPLKRSWIGLSTRLEVGTPNKESH